jgi:hypothetical protein
MSPKRLQNHYFERGYPGYTLIPSTGYRTLQNSIATLRMGYPDYPGVNSTLRPTLWVTSRGEALYELLKLLLLYSVIQRSCEIRLKWDVIAIELEGNRLLAK